MCDSLKSSGTLGSNHDPKYLILIIIINIQFFIYLITISFLSDVKILKYHNSQIITLTSESVLYEKDFNLAY